MNNFVEERETHRFVIQNLSVKLLFIGREVLDVHLSDHLEFWTYIYRTIYYNSATTHFERTLV
jgi:hypothetical protein